MDLRLIAAGIVTVGLIFTHWFAYSAGQEHTQVRWDRQVSEQKTQALKAQDQAREKERNLIAERQKVEEKYVQQKRKDDLDAAAARTELERLRDELASPGRQACPDTASSGRAYAGVGLERELLGHCATALVGLAQEADRLEGLVVGLQGYVRNVCTK